jgi:predicted transposase/invertase (TIGR01784 family)
MDPAIQEMQKKIDWINGDPTLLRTYLRYVKAESDEITRIAGAKRETQRETQREIAAKMKRRGTPIDQIAEDTGLSVDEVARL